MTNSQPALTVYGAPWCPHCKRVKRFLAAHRVAYENVDIDERPGAIDTIKELQGGGQIIPTVVYGDGTHEVNPSDEALARRVGLSLEAERAAYDLVIIGGGAARAAAGPQAPPGRGAAPRVGGEAPPRPARRPAPTRHP